MPQGTRFLWNVFEAARVLPGLKLDKTHLLVFLTLRRHFYNSRIDIRKSVNTKENLHNEYLLSLGSESVLGRSQFSRGRG